MKDETRNAYLRYSAVVSGHLRLCVCPAQPTRPPEPKQDDQSEQRQDDTVDQLREIATELRAIRERQARAEQRETTYQAKQREGVFWPPIWSNWALAMLTAVAAGIAVRTLRALREQVGANILAANAAKQSADIAEKTLKVASQVVIDIMGHGVATVTDPHSGEIELIAQYGIKNLSGNFAQNIDVRIDYGIGDAMDHTITLTVPVLAPDKSIVPPMRISPLTAEQRAAFDAKALTIGVRMSLAWRDPLGYRNDPPYVIARTLAQIPGCEEWSSNQTLHAELHNYKQV